MFGLTTRESLSPTQLVLKSTNEENFMCPFVYNRVLVDKVKYTNTKVQRPPIADLINRGPCATPITIQLLELIQLSINA